MFAICDTLRTLNEAFYCRASYVESLLLFMQRYPDARSVLVFRDVRGRGNAGDLQFVNQLFRKDLDKIKNSYLPVQQDSARV